MYKSNNNYRSINKFGSNFHSEVDNPITYCLNDTLDKGFLHGGNAYIYGQSSKPCQQFWGEYCAQQWDGLCETASKNTNMFFPNNTFVGNINNRPYNLKGLTAGDYIVRNTASNKYLISMGNCTPQYQPFDPTVANSPMIRSWVSNTGQNNCIPVYAVDPSKINDDIVMNKILSKPQIALDMLVNIYNTHKRMYGSVDNLQGTRLYDFFANNPQFFN